MAASEQRLSLSPIGKKTKFIFDFHPVPRNHSRCRKTWPCGKCFVKAVNQNGAIPKCSCSFSAVVRPVDFIKLYSPSIENKNGTAKQTKGSDAIFTF